LIKLINRKLIFYLLLNRQLIKLMGDSSLHFVPLRMTRNYVIGGRKWLAAAAANHFLPHCSIS